VFLIPSAVFEAASMTPVIGLKTNPATPLVTPFRNPNAPPFSAP